MVQNQPGQDYRSAGFSRKQLEESPFALFQIWYQDALGAGCSEPTAFVLATASMEGEPSARTLLAKEVSEDGIVFYTNKESLKGRDLAGNPRATALFYWSPLVRQVIFRGRVEELDSESEDRYFATRPRRRQLGATASRQGSQLASRVELLERIGELEKEYEGEEIPRPAYWGGYRLIPDRIEFWYGGEDRLHDRFCYVLESDGQWSVRRLSP